MRARGLVVALAIAAIVAAAVVSIGGHKRSGGGATTAVATGPVFTTTTPVAANAVHVSFAFSPEKEKMLLPLIARFNREDHDAAGRPVVVEGANVSSGAAESGLVKGTLKPVVWSPSSSLWGRLLDFQADRPWVPRDNPSIVRTPLVIAMWEPLAQALGWPRKPIGWSLILKLATSKTGWAAYGKPTYGAFKLGHTNPDFSTSGLSAVAAQYFTVAGKREGLTVADVNRPAVRAKVRAIQQSIVHYGDTTLFFADQLRAHGPGYASAVAMEEATLVDFNQHRPAGLPRLVAIYPSDGTFVSDNPFIVLDAPWVTPAQHAGAKVFGDWLSQQIDAQLAAANGFRAADPNTKPEAPLDATNGVDPAQPSRVLELPEPRVLARIRQAWHEDRKPANVMLVVDTSGSMSDEQKLVQAKQGLSVFLHQLSSRDRVGLIWFEGRVHAAVPVRPFGKDATQLTSTINDLVADGDTALYDAVAEGVGEVDALKDESRINAVVVLTDGADTASSLSSSSLVARLRARSQSEGRQIRVFTIAYGSAPNRQVLQEIADASGGKAYAGDPTEIQAVYLQISSFF